MVATFMSLWWVFLLCCIGCIIGLVAFNPAFKAFRIFGAKDEKQFEARVDGAFNNFGKNTIVSVLCGFGAWLFGVLTFLSFVVNIVDYFTKK